MYLVHGFKWKRVPIRHHVILNNVDEAAPDYIMQYSTPDALRESFMEKWPEIMKNIPRLHFLEQYNPEDHKQSYICQPYAFVADRVIEAELNINIREAQEKGPSISPAAWDAFVDLKEKLAGKDEEIGWFVVYNGNTDREDEVRVYSLMAFD